MSLSKSVDHPYPQFRKIYVLNFPWFNFKWSMTLYLAIRYANKINKWTYICTRVLYILYTSYMFWPLVWTSSEGAIRRIYNSKYYRSFWNDEQIYIILTFWSLLVIWCTKRFSIQEFYILPHCIYVFCISLRTNSDFCPI